MPVAIDDPSRIFADRHKTNSRHQAVANVAATNDPQNSDALGRLRNLLICTPIDLSAISDEIRRHPDLESLVLRLGMSLALSPDEPLSTIEEAVVVLGTSRLRVLIDLWSSAPRSISADASNSQLPSHASLSPTEAPEVGYLSNFLRCLESDSSGNGERLAAWASKFRPTSRIR